MCPRRSRPRSAAKQGRSFLVAPINSAPTRFSGGHILGKGPPRDRPPAQSKMDILRKEFGVAKSGLDFRIPNWTAWLLARGLGSKNGPSSARVCPKGSGPCSAAKQRRSFRVPPINHPEACVPEAVEATFCSKTGPIFSCGSNKR